VSFVVCRSLDPFLLVLALVRNKLGVHSCELYTTELKLATLTGFYTKNLLLQIAIALPPSSPDTVLKGQLAAQNSNLT
jgi:hypothetical protein